MVQFKKRISNALLSGVRLMPGNGTMQWSKNKTKEHARRKSVYEGKKMKKILLRGSWQTINIGDIAHTPGFLSLAKDYLPEAEVWLWPCSLDRGVREMMLENYPGLRIVESEEDVLDAFDKCEMLIHGSGPIVNSTAIEKWRKFSDKPYVIYGVTTDGLWTPEKK